MLQAGTHEGKFNDLNDRLLKLSQDLQLGIAVQQLSDREQDRIDNGTISPSYGVL